MNKQTNKGLKGWVCNSMVEWLLSVCGSMGVGNPSLVGHYYNTSNRGCWSQEDWNVRTSKFMCSLYNLEINPISKWKVDVKRERLWGFRSLTLAQQCEVRGQFLVPARKGKEGKKRDSGLAQVCNFSYTGCWSRRIASWWCACARAS